MPRSLEQSYTNESEKNNVPENLQANLEKYVELELGDVTQDPTSSSTPTSPVPQTSQQQGQSQVDPVQIVQNMISAGFSPTKAQINLASQNLSGPTDSSNKWFSFFLQHIVQQQKKKKQKNQK